MYPYSNPSSIFRGLKTIKWSSLLDGTQKTLGVINQAIPLVYQVKPLINNAKTMFNVVNAINDNGTNNNKSNNIGNSNNSTNNNISTNNTNTNNSPIFYI